MNIIWTEEEAESVKSDHKSSDSGLTGFNALATNSTLYVHYGAVSSISLLETAYVGMTEWLTCTPGLFEPWLRCRSICNAILKNNLQKDSKVYVHLFMDTNLTEAEVLALIPDGVKPLNKKEGSMSTGVMYIVTAGRVNTDFQLNISVQSDATQPTNFQTLIGAMRKKFKPEQTKFHLSGVVVEESACDEYVMMRFGKYSDQNETNVQNQLAVVKKEVSAIVPDITPDQLDDLIAYIGTKLKIEK